MSALKQFSFFQWMEEKTLIKLLRRLIDRHISNVDGDSQVVDSALYIAEELKK